MELLRPFVFISVIMNGSFVISGFWSFCGFGFDLLFCICWFEVIYVDARVDRYAFNKLSVQLFSFLEFIFHYYVFFFSYLVCLPFLFAWLCRKWTLFPGEVEVQLILSFSSKSITSIPIESMSFLFIQFWQNLFKGCCLFASFSSVLSFFISWTFWFLCSSCSFSVAILKGMSYRLIISFCILFTLKDA